MKLYREAKECIATDILKRHGYELSNPDESLVTSQIWAKDGIDYKFTGWENTPNTNFQSRNPKYINIEEC